MICCCTVTSRPGGRLVEHDEIRLAGERHGDRDALLLAAGKPVRIALQQRRRIGQADLLDQFRQRAAMACAVKPLCGRSTSAIWSPTVIAGLSAVVGFCGTKPMRLPRRRCSAAASQRRDVGAARTAPSRRQRAHWADVAEHLVGERALAGAAFADEAEDLAALHVEATSATARCQPAACDSRG